MDENSGLKAHETLAPAYNNHENRQIICGGQGSLDQFRMAKIIETPVIEAMKILCSRRGAFMIWFCAAVHQPPSRGPVSIRTNNGFII